MTELLGAREIRELAESLGIRPTKKLGQNFRLSFAKAGFAFMSKNILNRSASALFNHIIAVDP